jgi:methyl-accepting chemotaxis protein
VAVISLGVGGVGLWGMSRLINNLNDVSRVRLPSVKDLLTLNYAYERIRVAQRTLLSPRLNPEDYRRQFANLARAAEQETEAWRHYETLPMSPQGQQAWQEFKRAVADWKKENDGYLRAVRELEATDIRDPVALMRDLQRFTGDHYSLGLKLANLLERGETFEGGHDPLGCAFGKWMSGFKTANPELNRCVSEIQASHQQFHQSAARVKELVAAGKRDEAATLVRGDLQKAMGQTFKAFGLMLAEAEKASRLYDNMYEGVMVRARARQDRVLELLGGLIVMNEQASEDSTRNAQANSRLARTAALVAMGSGFLIALTLGTLLTRTIKRSITLTVDLARRVADGDLTRQVAVHQNDETGQLANAMNSMVTRLRDLVAGIRECGRTLAGAAGGLSATSSQLASGAEETTAQSSTVAAAAEEMSVNMTHMAASSEQMSASIRSVAAAVEQMGASISEVARNAEQAAGVAGNAARLAEVSNDRIGQLGSAANEIGRVIEVIQDIAEQTNLLALNATIEAARAGDSGKGFAVVATEVKELARQTADATEDIRRRIEGIQSATGEAVQSIGEISQVIGNVNSVSRTIASAVEEQSITTREIAQSVSEAATASSTVSQGVAQSASASREITQSISGVDVAARQTAQGAAQTQNAGAEMARLAEQLQGLVDRFTV